MRVRRHRRARKGVGVVKAVAGNNADNDGLWWDSSINQLYSGPGASSSNSKPENIFRDDNTKSAASSPSGSGYLDSLRSPGSATPVAGSSPSGSPRRLFSAQPAPQYSPGGRNNISSPSSGNRYSAANQIAALKSEETRLGSPASPAPQGSYLDAISSTTAPSSSSGSASYASVASSPAPGAGSSYLDGISGGAASPSAASAYQTPPTRAPAAKKRPTPLTPAQAEQQAPVTSYLDQLSPRSQAQVSSQIESLSPRSQLSYIDSLKSGTSPVVPSSERTAAWSPAPPPAAAGAAAAAAPVAQSSYLDNINNSPRQPEQSRPQYSAPPPSQPPQYSAPPPPPQQQYSPPAPPQYSPPTPPAAQAPHRSPPASSNAAPASPGGGASYLDAISSPGGAASRPSYSAPPAAAAPSGGGYLDALSGSAGGGAPASPSGSSYLDSLTGSGGGYSAAPMQAQSGAAASSNPTMYADAKRAQDLGFSQQQQQQTRPSDVGFSTSTTSTSPSQTVGAGEVDSLVMPKGYAVLEAFLEDVAARPTLYLNIGGISSGVVALAAVLSAVLDQLNNVPVVPDALKLIGVAYSAWFFVRYTVSRDFRDTLNKDVAGTFDVPRQET